MRYVAVYAGDRDWGTVDACLIDAPNPQEVIRHLGDALKMNGLEGTDISDILREERYFIGRCDGPADYVVKGN